MIVSKKDSRIFLNKHGLFMYFGALAVTYILCSPLVLAPFYDWLLFHPDKHEHPEINNYMEKIVCEFKTKRQDIFIQLPSGKKIHAWYFKKPEDNTTFLVSHGNGGNICYRLPLIASLLKYGSVFIYDYEGYGRSEGSPSRETARVNGLAAYDYLVNKEHLKPANIVLYGESLGCAVTCEISKSRAARGIILQSPWARLLQVARDRFALPRFYPDWTFGEPRFDNIAILTLPHPPLLLIHGKQDNILPYRYSEELFTKACEPKRLVLLPNASHNDVGIADSALYYQSMADFLNAIQ